MIFQPFELNTNHALSITIDVDLGIKFNNKIGVRAGFNCNYNNFNIGEFVSDAQSEDWFQSFWSPVLLCNMDIRNIPTNPGKFEAYLQCLDVSFSIFPLQLGIVLFQQDDIFNEAVGTSLDKLNFKDKIWYLDGRFKSKYKSLCINTWFCWFDTFFFTSLIEKSPHKNYKQVSYFDWHLFC